MVKWLFPYIVIFLLNIIEGSIITVGAGMAIRNSEINFWITYFVIVSADVMSDFLYYYLGHKSKRLLESPYLRLVGITPKRLKKVASFYKKHGIKALIVAKFSDVFAVPAIVLAGSTNMSRRKFAVMSVGTATVKGLMLLAGGYFIGLSFANDFRFVSELLSGSILILVSVFVSIAAYKRISK